MLTCLVKYDFLIQHDDDQTNKHVNQAICFICQSQKTARTHHSECRVGVGHTAAPVGGASSLERWVPCRVQPESGMTNVAWTALGTLWCDPAGEGWGPCQNHISGISSSK